MTDFVLRWHEGASAQLEIFSPQSGGPDLYQLKYTSAFRATLRPPVQRCNLTPIELQPIEAQLDALMKTLDARASGAAAAPAAAGVGQPAISDQMATLGGMLCTMTIPQYVMSDLGRASVFLEIGVDETILAYPWELMHDGEEFLCLKHDMGRFVNASSAAHLLQQVTRRERLPKLSVLLIAVARPNRAAPSPYEPLESVDAEATAITALLSAYPDDVNLKVLAGQHATFNAVFDAIKAREYDVIHYCGHAVFDEKEPRMSRLALFDRDMRTGAVVSFFSRAKPLLCFINGCETARGAVGKDRLNVYGLGQAFIETGAYVLGSRWKVGDKVAAAFAQSFYAEFLAGRPLGSAVRTARQAGRALAADELGWASYVLYGDPRLSIRRA